MKFIFYIVYVTDMSKVFLYQSLILCLLLIDQNVYQLNPSWLLSETSLLLFLLLETKPILPVLCILWPPFRGWQKTLSYILRKRNQTKVKIVCTTSIIVVKY